MSLRNSAVGEFQEFGQSDNVAFFECGLNFDAKALIIGPDYLALEGADMLDCKHYQIAGTINVFTAHTEAVT